MFLKKHLLWSDRERRAAHVREIERAQVSQGAKFLG